MKKLLILFLAFCLTTQFVNAKRLYVEMEYIKNTIRLNDGSNKKPQTVKGTDGEDLKFKSLIGALNYMSLQGWELLDTKPINGGDASHTVVAYYIFYKDVSDEELEATVKDSFKQD